MGHGTLMDEDFPARVEAIFSDRGAAEAAARTLSQRFDFDEERLSMVSTDRAGTHVHRNRFAFKASGRRLQKRQLTATFMAFTLIGIGLCLLQLSGFSGLYPLLTATIMAGLILAAVGITVIGLLSWRPARVETRHRLKQGETVLVVQVHDVSEQYALRDALMKMGAQIEGAASARVS
jgi:hypothetical protein